MRYPDPAPHATRRHQRQLDRLSGAAALLVSLVLEPCHARQLGDAVTDLLHALGFGLITAALVGISAVALSLQYGVTNFANFAHGELLTVGAYAAYGTQHWTTDLLVQVAVGSAAAALVAVLINIVVIRPFVQTTARLVILLVVTAALSQIIQGGLSFGFGLDNVVLRRPTEVVHSYG